MSPQKDSRILVRPVAEGYGVYDYPKDRAHEIAELAAAQFSEHFNRVVPSIGITVQNVPRRYIEVRGSPFLNFTFQDGNGSCGVVAENDRGELALELRVHKGAVASADGNFHRWDTELRAPDWRLISADPELL